MTPKAVCSSTFGDGVFMVYYARTMHFRHQGSNAIGVRTSDMSPYYLPSGKRPYISHTEYGYRCRADLGEAASPLPKLYSVFSE